MKAYMAYDNVCGPSEGACLVFANTAREAKKISFPTVRGWLDTEFTDHRVKLLHDTHLFDLKAKDSPHVIENPPVCENCETWGGHPVDAPGHCGFCEAEYDYPDE